MSELPNHGTGWSETEVLLDLIALYNADDFVHTQPDFTAVQRRLREKFNSAELHALDAIVTVLQQFIRVEITRRNSEGAPT